MSNTTASNTTASATTARGDRAPRRTKRAIGFRIVAVLLGVIYLFLFGSLTGLISPWVVLPDTTDHGWLRTPALHRWADSAAGVTMTALGVGALLAAWRPLRTSALASFVGFLLTVVGLSSGISVLLQGHMGPLAALAQAVVIVAVSAVPLVLLHPQRRAVLAGGMPATDGPRSGLRVLFGGLAVAGVLLALGSVVWRMSGGLIESPLEDDVISFVLFGLTIGGAAAVAAAGRAGWRPVAWILVGVLAYAAAATVSLLLS